MSSLQTVIESTRSLNNQITVTAPTVADGADIWRVAKASSELDLNSSYMYLLFARDFAETSRIAIIEGELVGFVLAYRRAEAPETLFVWQVAVDEDHRGKGIARSMLDELIQSTANDELPIRTLETTVTDDNVDSQRLFARLADRWDADLRISTLFDSKHFPDEHDAERVHVISPLDPSTGV